MHCSYIFLALTHWLQMSQMNWMKGWNTWAEDIILHQICKHNRAVEWYLVSLHCGQIEPLLRFCTSTLKCWCRTDIPVWFQAKDFPLVSASRWDEECGHQRNIPPGRQLVSTTATNFSSIGCQFWCSISGTSYRCFPCAIKLDTNSPLSKMWL